MNDSLRMKRTFGLGASGVGVLVFTALTSACDSSKVTNNYFLTPAPPADAGDGGDTRDTFPEAAQSSASVSETSSSASTSQPDSGAFSESAAVDAGATSEASGPSMSSSDAGHAEDASVEPLAEGAPVVNTPVGDLALDVFGTNQNQYWFIATPEQISVINDEFHGGYGGNDIYAPGSNSSNRTIEHLLVTTPDGKTADFGEMQVKLVGQSTGRPWTESTLPNFKIDSDDVTPGLRVGGYEHLRFNNAIVGSIYREKFIYDYYGTLGYPAPRSTYGWVSSSAWQPDVKVPYIVVESYKRGFCRERPDYFGGECPNMWEFASDMGWGVFDIPENCQFESCDSTRANQLEAVVVQAQAGLATVDEVGEYVDWQRFHQFQCLSWIFGTGDDAIHGGNNTVWVERPDGKFQLLPYSIDISLWGGDVGLDGYTAVADICQNDAGCWADTIETCEGLIEAFIAADPVARIDALHEELDDAGMLRAGDDQRHTELRNVLGDLVTTLPGLLEQYRDNPWGPQYCSYPQVDCGGYCQFPANCYLCQDWYYEPGNSGETTAYASGTDVTTNTATTTGATTTAVPPMGTAMGAAADIALPLPKPIPNPSFDPVPEPPASTPDVDGGAGTGSDYPKPDFCYWDYGNYYRNDAYRLE